MKTRLSNGRQTKEYTAWCNIKARCRENSKDKRNYFDKGIGMCSELSSSFKLFIEHIGEAPDKNFEVDRIDNSKGYIRGNIRWVSRSVNCFNKPPSVESSKSGLPRGVYKQGNRYRSYFSVELKTIQIGYFKTIEEARNAYILHTKEWFGFSN